jgi:hypothetical protein
MNQILQGLFQWLTCWFQEVATAMAPLAGARFEVGKVPAIAEMEIKLHGPSMACHRPVLGLTPRRSEKLPYKND